MVLRSGGFIQICFQSLLSLKQVCCACFECICEAMLESVKLPDKAFAERYVFVLFQVIIQSLVNFAVGYKYTKSSKHDKSFPQDFFIISLSTNFMPSCVFHSVCVFLKTLTLKKGL